MLRKGKLTKAVRIWSKFLRLTENTCNRADSVYWMSSEILLLFLLLPSLFGFWTSCLFISFSLWYEAISFCPAFVAVMIGLGTIIPSSPNYIGECEALGILALAPFGVEKEVSLGFYLILRFVIFSVATAVGFLCFVREFGSLKEGTVKLLPIQAN